MLNFTQLFPNHSGSLNERFKKLNKLIKKCATCPFPIADDLQRHTLFISETLSKAYKTTELNKKIVLYSQTSITIGILQKLLGTSLVEEPISKKQLTVITADLQALNKSIKRIILLLEEHAKGTDPPL